MREQRSGSGRSGWRPLCAGEMPRRPRAGAAASRALAPELDRDLAEVEQRRARSDPILQGELPGLVDQAIEVVLDYFVQNFLVYF